MEPQVGVTAIFPGCLGFFSEILIFWFGIRATNFCRLLSIPTSIAVVMIDSDAMISFSYGHFFVLSTPQKWPRDKARCYFLCLE